MKPFVGAVSLALVTCVACFAQDFAVKDDGTRIEISELGQPVLTYIYRSAKSEGSAASPTQQDSGYFHPVYGLYGEVLTGESPSNWSGAPGIHWGWSRLGAGGKVVDLERGVGGRREFERVLREERTATGVRVALQNVWLAGSEDRAQVLETLSFTVNPVVKAQRNIDVSIRLTNIAPDKIYLSGSMPGSGFTFTLNPERSDWSFSSGQSLVPTPDKPFLSPFLICSYRDDHRSSRSGIAIFQDARNPGYAQPNWLIETPERMVAGVAESTKAELSPGDFLEFRYRFVITHLTGSAGEMTAEYAKFMAEGQRRE